MAGVKFAAAVGAGGSIGGGVRRFTAFVISVTVLEVREDVSSMAMAGRGGFLYGLRRLRAFREAVVDDGGTTNLCKAAAEAAEEGTSPVAAAVEELVVASAKDDRRRLVKKSAALPVDGFPCINALSHSDCGFSFTSSLLSGEPLLLFADTGAAAATATPVARSGEL